MKWFGESWGAPVCVPEDHVATPVGASCLRCHETVAAEDIGVMMPYFGALDAPVELIPMHHACLMRSVIPDWDARQSGTRLTHHERSQCAWEDWDEEEIARELAPWPNGRGGSE